mgnify:CR=1 FL=1
MAFGLNRITRTQSDLVEHHHVISDDCGLTNHHTIAVIDYGMGNLHSVAKALEHVTHENVIITRDPRRILGATRVVLPGQGAIRDCVGELERTELRGLVEEILTRQAKPLLELHELTPDQPYWIGMFLGGAYQEVMGNLHNLFGSTNAVHIRLADGGGYWVDHVVRGNTNAEVLEAMEHDPELLLERLRVASETAIQRGDLKISDARRLMDHLETSLRQTTYLQN